MNIFTFFTIVCLMFVTVTAIGCLLYHVKSKRQHGIAPVIGNELLTEYE